MSYTKQPVSPPQQAQTAREIVEAQFGTPETSAIYQTAGRLIERLIVSITEFGERRYQEGCESMREDAAKVCDQHAENMARHGDAALAEQSRQDALAIRALVTAKEQTT